MTERITALTELIKHTDIFASQKEVAYDPMDLALPTAVFNAKRITEYILAQDVYLTETNRFPGLLRYGAAHVPGDFFTRTGHAAFYAAQRAFYNQPRENLAVFEWQHSTPDYELVLNHGMRRIFEKIARAKQTHRYDREKSEYLDGVEIVCNGVVKRAEKYASFYRDAAEKTADAARKAELNALADALSHVPAEPAASFYEGLVCVLFCFSYLPDSIGTIDRYLLPLYRKDIASGVLTRETAFDLIQEFFTYISAFAPYTSSNYDRSAECHFAIGGYDENGDDGYNELSDLIVDALMDLDTVRPQISLRHTKKTPYAVLKKLLTCEKNDRYKRIAFVGEEPRLAALENILGLPRRDAIRYTMVGCNEPAIPGSVWFGGCTANIARSMTRTLSEKKKDAIRCADFEEFFALYTAMLQEDLERILFYLDSFNAMRAKDINVLSGFLIDGSIESGISPSRGGMRIKVGGCELMGLVCVIDSLSIIKQFVYDEKRVSMAELIDALESNWESAPLLRNEIRNTGKFFGNSYELSDGMARRVNDKLFDFSNTHTLAGGGKILFGTLAGYNPHYAYFGKLTQATPDGRCNGDFFTVGSGQGCGKDREGLAALLQSVAGMNPSGVLCGPFLCNVLIDEKSVRDEKSFDKLCHVLESYFNMGGLHVQLNYASEKELREARENPEKYRNLRVRVSGFSASYVKLSKETQDEILARTVNEQK